MDQLLSKFNYLKSTNLDYIDEIFEKFLKDPNSIDPSWRYFFEGMELGELSNGHENGHAAREVSTTAASSELPAEAKVIELIRAFREHGIEQADINPLFASVENHPLLTLARFELTESDLDRTYQAGKLIGLGPAKLRDILVKLRTTYCGTLGVEMAQMTVAEERSWLERQMETKPRALDTTTRQFILKRVTESETLERFLHTRYVAQKRFSVEGGESVIPALDCLIEAGAELGAREFVIGMAHRGRLNVLVNIFGKKPEYILTEFEGAYKPDTADGEGDVKYHMGYSADTKTRQGNPVHLSLAFNPSHLEFINPVIEGTARAKQTFLKDAQRTQVIPIQIHGDAAFSGQGVVYETLNMSLLEGYRTGGTIHIVINNQVGFTTSPKDSRSTPFCTDMAKMLGTPVFHVNGDDPEAAWRAARICMEYRQQFKKDAFIDLICYRKHGHNEGDEPTFTQPVLYKVIKDHPSTREVYSKRLAAEGVTDETKSQSMIDGIIEKFTEAQQRTRAEAPKPYISSFEGRWKGFKKGADADNWKTIDTTVSEKSIKDIASKINQIPRDFHLHPKLTRFFEARLKAVNEGKGIDWGNGEALAYASLVAEGHPIRLTGQDAERGTFTHRHSVLNDVENGATYVPFNHVREGQASYDVHNSLLSETAVMAFEYGYSIADPLSLVLWEAQFGDFANGAQVIIDQFLAASESKWQRMSGLVLLLPHGYEGQAAEHSSARLERFLQLSGRNNLIVCNFTTPAQLFHALRRQVKRDFRKPLIVMTPKSLLRHPHAISTLDDFTKRGFQEVLDDAAVKATDVKRVILCSGKVYYDLLAERDAKKLAHIALLRLEQFYPWPEEKLASAIARYKSVKDIVWVQEEPRNMGAWTYVFNQWQGGYGNFKDRAGAGIRYIGREVGAASAVGSGKIHEKEQRALVEAALGDQK